MSSVIYLYHFPFMTYKLGQDLSVVAFGVVRFHKYENEVTAIGLRNVE